MMKGKRQGGGKDGVDNLIGEAALNNFVNSDGSVTINVNEFLKLVRHASAHDRADDPKPSPVPWQVVGLDVNAETSASCVSFTCDFVVRSFSQDWVKVPLLPASYAFDKFSVSGPQPVGTNSTDGGVAADSSATEDIQADGRQPSVVGSAGDVSVLLPSPGDYTVSISGLAPFQNERKSGFQLTIKTDVLRSSLSCTVSSHPSPPTPAARGTHLCVAAFRSTAQTLTSRWTLRCRLSQKVSQRPLPPPPVPPRSRACSETSSVSACSGRRGSQRRRRLTGRICWRMSRLQQL